MNLQPIKTREFFEAKKLLGISRLIFLLSFLPLTTSCSVGFISQTPQMPVIIEPMGELTVLESSSSQDLEPLDQLAKLDSESKAQLVDPDAQQQARQAELEALDQENTPFSMQVAQKFYNNDSLILRVHLTTKVAVSPADLAVEAVGLRNGEVISRDLRFLDSVISTPILESDKKISVSLQLDDPSITEYQIRGMWGADAHAKRLASLDNAGKKEILDTAANMPIPASSMNSRASLATNLVEPNLSDQKESTPPEIKILPENQEVVASSNPLVLEIIKTDRKATDCGGQDNCPEIVTMYGILENKSNSAISDIRLAVGLFWQEGDTKPQLPAPGSAITGNEREVRLPTAILLPGEKKRIRLFVDRELPVIPGGRFIAKARVLSLDKISN